MSKVHLRVFRPCFRDLGQSEHGYNHNTACGYVRERATNNVNRVTKVARRIVYLMNIRLNQDDRVRVDGDTGYGVNFLDIRKADFAGLEVTLFSYFQYIEIRKKGALLKVFTFPKKSLKKDFDFGEWRDAEVVYSCNEQQAHKG